MVFTRRKVGKTKREILPRSKNQLEYLKALRNKDVVFGVGPAGTGKTYLAMAVAVSELLAGNCSRIVLTRPAKEAGETLGFLPGSLEEKIMPYLRPLYDALYDMLDFNEASSLIERNVIEVAPEPDVFRRIPIEKAPKYCPLISYQRSFCHPSG